MKVNLTSSPQTTPMAGDAGAKDAPRPKVVQSLNLMGAQKALAIEHGGQLYTLRVTKNNKLILTK